MYDLIEDVLAATFDNSILDTLEDQARLPLAELSAQGDPLAFATDSYIVGKIQLIWIPGRIALSTRLIGFLDIIRAPSRGRGPA